MPHIIRLREPWKRERLENGTVRLTRRFHRPTGLDAKSRVWLVVEDVDWEAEIALNERLLGRAVCSQGQLVGTAHPTEMRACPVRFEITDMLRPENLVSIVVSSPLLGEDGRAEPRPGREGQPGGLIGLVRLEIEA